MSYCLPDETKSSFAHSFNRLVFLFKLTITGSRLIQVCGGAQCLPMAGIHTQLQRGKHARTVSIHSEGTLQVQLPQVCHRRLLDWLQTGCTVNRVFGTVFLADHTYSSIHRTWSFHQGGQTCMCPTVNLERINIVFDL